MLEVGKLEIKNLSTSILRRWESLNSQLEISNGWEFCKKNKKCKFSNLWEQKHKLREEKNDKFSAEIRECVENKVKHITANFEGHFETSDRNHGEGDQDPFISES